MLTRVEINGSDLECKNLGEIEIEYTQSSEDACFQIVKELGTKLMFTGVQYDTIKTLTSSLCNKVTAVLYQNCDGVESVFFNGFFTKTNCEFNDDICQVEIKVEDDSKYNCFIKSWENEINILESTPQVSMPYSRNLNLTFGISIFAGGTQYPPVDLLEYGVVASLTGVSPSSTSFIFARVEETTTCLAGVPQDPTEIPPAGSSWYLINNDCSSTNTSTYGRPTVVGTNGDFPPTTSGGSTAFGPLDWGTDGIFAAGNTGVPSPAPSSFSDPLLVGFYYFSSAIKGVTGSSLAVGTYTFYIEYTDLYPPLANITNGRFLKNTIEFMLDRVNCGLSYSSQFFDSNSSVGFNTNPVTGVFPSPTSGLLLFQQSDIALPFSTERARIANVSIKTLLSDLNVLFNVWWQIDEITGDLIIEHWSTLNNISSGLDITQDPYSKTAKNNNSYTFSKASIPNKEEFRFAIESNDVDFEGLGITYDASCAGSSSIKRQTQQILTDFNQVYDNEEFKTEGLVLVAYGSLIPNSFQSQNGRITGVFKPNAPLGYGATLPDYYTYNRPLNEGVINNNTVIFDSTERLKNLKEITINFCCAFDDANKLITTYQGPGLLQNGTYSPLKKTLTLNIITEL